LLSRKGEKDCDSVGKSKRVLMKKRGLSRTKKKKGKKFHQKNQQVFGISPHRGGEKRKTKKEKRRPPTERR